MKEAHKNFLTLSMQISYHKRQIPIALAWLIHKKNLKCTWTLIKPPKKPDPKAIPDPPFYQMCRMKTENGKTIIGQSQCVSYLVQDLDQSITKWINLVNTCILGVTDQQHLYSALFYFHNLLKFSTFCNGKSFSLADVYLYSALINLSFWNKILFNCPQNVHCLVRWFKLVDSNITFRESIKGVHFFKQDRIKAKAGPQKSSGKVQGKMKLSLPNAIMGKVCTRFPPEPSGCLHIGHAKAAFINEYFATNYKGKLLIRFDDTNPIQEKQAYVDQIIRDLKSLGIDTSNISYTSDYFGEMQQECIKLIKSGHLYGSQETQEETSHQKREGIPSKFRDRPVQESLDIFAEMVKGSAIGKKSIIRAKMFPTHKNRTLRDPTLWRVLVDENGDFVHHYRQGYKYKAYPVYDFVCPFIDSKEGVTHALRSQEYGNHDPIFHWIIKVAKLRPVYVGDYSRLEFTFTTMSKRKLQLLINEKIANGWDDPRFYTIQGLLRRGLSVEAMRKYMISIGGSKVESLTHPNTLWTLNKKLMDPVIPRFSCVTEKNKVAVSISNVGFLADSNSCSTSFSVETPQHPQQPKLGIHHVTRSKSVFIDQNDAKTLAKGQTICLLNWGNLYIDSLSKNSDNIVTGIAGHLVKGKIAKTKISWIAAKSAGQEPEKVALDLVTFDELISAPRLTKEQSKNFMNYVIKDSWFVNPAIGDGALRNLKKGDRLQLWRNGYWIVDQAYSAQDPKLVLFSIPDGSASDRMKAQIALEQKQKTT